MEFTLSMESAGFSRRWRAAGPAFAKAPAGKPLAPLPKKTVNANAADVKRFMDRLDGSSYRKLEVCPYPCDRN
jgi:hypothetical protein